MATESTTQATETKVTFTPEQQARIDEIIRESMGRAGSDIRKENETLSSRLTELQAELAAAKDEAAKAKPGAAKKEAAEEVVALQSQIAEMKGIQAQTAAEMDRLKQLAASKDKDVEAAKREALNVRKQVAIQSTAALHGFVDVDVVTALTQESIQFDAEKNKFIVVGENGQPRLNSAYETMNLEEFFQEFAQKKPYLVRGDVKPGAGSTEAQRSAMNAAGKYPVDQIFGAKSDPSLANKLALQNPKEYARLKSQAREQKLITW